MKVDPTDGLVHYWQCNNHQCGQANAIKNTSCHRCTALRRQQFDVEQTRKPDAQELADVGMINRLHSDGGVPAAEIQNWTPAPSNVTPQDYSVAKGPTVKQPAISQSAISQLPISSPLYVNPGTVIDPSIWTELDEKKITVLSMQPGDGLILFISDINPADANTLKTVLEARHPSIGQITIVGKKVDAAVIVQEHQDQVVPKKQPKPTRPTPTRGKS